ncbi:hypothetical protein HOY82DRAFT_588963 [Tuber indicum]|nr:hypothetical protein HOY82DRAFT_588963 [Tuber indicum]
MLTYRIARSMLARKPPVPRSRPTQLHALGGLVRPITRTFQPPRFQEYSTDRNGSENASGVASAMQGLANRVTKLEKPFGTAMDDRFDELAKSLRVSLEKSLEKSVERSLRPINYAIEDIREWMRWLVGMVVIWVALEFAFYDLLVWKRFETRLDAMKERFTTRLDVIEERFTTRLDAMEGRFEKRLDAMDARLTMTIQNAIKQLKLELTVGVRERLLSAGGRGDKKQ